MKYIRMFFWIIFFGPTLAFSQEKPPALDSGWFHFLNALDTFVTDTRQAVQTAQNEPAAQASDVSWVNALFWDEKNVSPLTGTQGSTPLLSTPFGSIQLFTDVAGTKDKTVIYGVADIIIQNGWAVHKPIFHIDNQKNIRSATFLTPVTPPLKENQNKPYIINAAFPFVLKVTRPGVPIVLSGNIEITVCSADTCQTHPYPFSLELTGLTGETSPFKPFIASVWAFLPKPVPTGIAPIHRTSDDTVWIDIPNAYPISKADYILSSDEPVRINEERVIQEPRYTRLMLKTTPSLKGKPVRLIYAGPKGVWEIQPQVPTEKEIPAKGTSSDISWLKTGLLFLFFSPLLCWLLFFSPSNEYEARQKAGQTVVTFISAGLSAALYFGCCPTVYGSLFASFFWISACAFIFIIWYVLPEKPTPLAYVVLTGTAPLTYLAPVWDSADTGAEKASLCLFLTAMACLPYLFFYFRPYMAVRILKPFQSVSPYIIKLPIIGCAVWYLLMGGALYLNQRIDWPTYTSEAVRPLLDQKKIVMVSVGPDWCVTCTLNRLNLTYVGVAKTLLRQQQLVLMKSPVSPLTEDSFVYPQNVIMTHRLFKGEKAPAFLPDYHMQTFFNVYLTDQ